MTSLSRLYVFGDGRPGGNVDRPSALSLSAYSSCLYYRRDVTISAYKIAYMAMISVCHQHIWRLIFPGRDRGRRWRAYHYRCRAYRKVIVPMNVTVSQAVGGLRLPHGGRYKPPPYTPAVGILLYSHAAPITCGAGGHYHQPPYLMPAAFPPLHSPHSCW